MSRIFWDTNLFIYLFEDHSPRSQHVAALRERMLERNDQLCTSTLTLGEVLVSNAKMKVFAASTRKGCLGPPS